MSRPMDSIPFAKMHGCGNSFVIIDDRRNRIRHEAAVARELCSREFGIGADGLMLLRPSRRHDFRMSYRNADGSSGEMCGNGIRCLARFVHDRGISRERDLVFETGAGPIRTRVSGARRAHVRQVAVDMGEPRLRSRDVRGLTADRTSLRVGRRTFTFVSMGNPHAVTFVDDFDFNLAVEGRRVEENRRIFPNGTNVEFVQVRSAEALRLRVWERGCGITLACGTGACAAVVAATLAGHVHRGPVEVAVDGGELLIEWNIPRRAVLMTGPATLTAEGTVRLPDR